MRPYHAIFLFILLNLWSLPLLAESAFIAISYHDVRDDVQGDLDPDYTAVSTAHLIAQFDWLRAHGYQPVSIDDLLAARDGRRPLPEKAVLLTFDDGLKSVYTRVFPLLKAYRYPAVVAVVGDWLDAATRTEIDYLGTKKYREDFVTWDELAEMAASGLVEVASHSHNLHHGILGNPQGNLQPAAVTRLYDPASGRYEDEAAYRARLRADLALSAAHIAEHLGQRPRVIVWPYGAYSGVTEEIAAELGMTVSFGLHLGINRSERLQGLQRVLLDKNMDLDTFVTTLHHLERWSRGPAHLRVAQVDLDYLYDPDPVQQQKNFDHLLDRIKALDLTTVYLQAFADPDGDGTASALYFPNRHLPLRADLFNRVAWQLRTRAGVQVFAWLPVLAFDLPDPALNRALALERWDGTQRLPAGGDYRRLSPFKPQARQIIGEIYEDLAKAASFQGLLFHDDAYLGEHEGAAGGRLAARDKTLALTEFTAELAGRVRQYRAEIQTARNLYARPVLEPVSEAWFAQDLSVFLASYDQVALMAMPYLENADDPEAWLAALVERVRAVPDGLERTVFELQSIDWRIPQPIASERLAAQMVLLQQRGVRHLGYYPDDFINGHPDLNTLRPAIATTTFPYRRR